MFKNKADIKSIIRMVVVTLGILLIPLIAMLFTDEVNWTVGDFVVMGMLIFSIGLVYELFVRKINKTSYRTIAIVTLVICFFLIWAELAVGIFDTPFAGH
jgi:Kef-type K+ transport system membrane component KefB